MKALNEVEWGEFYIKDVFSKIQRGKRLKTEDHIKGYIPYVSSTAMCNGVDSFIGNEEGVRVFRDCLTLANSGSVGATFYHPYSFVASDHVTELSKNELTKYTYLFIATIVSRIASKYSFNREVNDKRIQKEKILLPITKEGSPDYVFMEEYMKEKERVILLQYKQYLSDLIDNQQITMGGVNLNNKIEWRCFMLGELFEFEVGRSKGLNHLSHCDKGINYLGATNVNNGVLCQVENKEEYVQKGNCIAFIRNGEGSMGYSVYKAEDFIATSDISVGYNPHLNKYSGMFITTIADKVRGKYNFGYKRSATRLAKESVMLPVMSDGQPDYAFMEAYMRNKESKCLKQYVDYLENLLN